MYRAHGTLSHGRQISTGQAPPVCRSAALRLQTHANLLEHCDEPVSPADPKLLQPKGRTPSRKTNPSSECRRGEGAMVGLAICDRADQYIPLALLSFFLLAGWESRALATASDPSPNPSFQ